MDTHESNCPSHGAKRSRFGTSPSGAHSREQSENFFFFFKSQLLRLFFAQQKRVFFFAMILIVKLASSQRIMTLT